MADRTQYQTQLRTVKPGANPAVKTAVLGLANDTWRVGALLTLKQGNRAASLGTTIDSTLSGPVKYIALEPFNGDGTKLVGVQEINSDMVFEVQAATTATIADIGKRGTLTRDTTTGNYRLNITSTNPAVEIVDVEPNFDPASPYKNGAYNKVWFKFLPEVLEKAPTA